ncbi:MAG: CCA tRNA nucleotidyltransferase [Planctomycetes bacterium]|nr:CCA tRNA nucleotidyltransferase [Planctomycetota bacterium]
MSAADSKPPALSPRDAALKIVQQLRKAGHEALFAGGCVRDMLMDHEPSDFDVATSARPEQVSSLFKRTQKVGAKFGVVLVRMGKQTVEVATFRRDLAYSDGRHPSGVEFTDAREDAKRRDFTINGMFFDPVQNEVVDYVGGRDDIARRVIRAIGEPTKRFAEDHLRLLRAVRFAARFEFEIDPATWTAMREHAPEIARISPERIREELEIVLTHPRRAAAVQLLHECGVLAKCWAHAAKVSMDFGRTSDELSHLPTDASFETALAVMLASLDETAIDESCDALRCSNYTKKTVQWLHAHRDSLDDPARLTLADLKLLMANPAFSELLTICAARVASNQISGDGLSEIKRRIAEIRPEDIAPPPLLTGHDLESMGFQPGPAFKKVLERAYYDQLNGTLHSIDEARAMARSMMP